MKAHQNKTKWFFITLAAMTLLGSIPANAARAPSNDQFRKAIGITSLPFTNAQNTSAARFSGSEPDPSCQGTSHTVWYVLTPDADTTITANTFGSGMRGGQGGAPFRQNDLDGHDRRVQ